MISVAEARALMLASAAPCSAVNVSLRSALARALREDVMASRDQPPFRASAMDGYALRAIDTPGPLRMIGEAGAGRALGRPLGAGECARIFTGAPLPAGADCVLIQEDAARDGEIVTAPLVEKGRHVRSAGVDFKSGDRLLQAGALIDAAAIALAAAAGRASLLVSRRPKVAVLSGGDELVSPGQSPGQDQIFDSMSVGIAALAEQWGGDATGIGPLADRAPDIANAISEAIAAHDLTVIVGGASVGDHDHARAAMTRLGAELLFEKVAVRPGKPTWFALRDGKPILGLPGNPASAFVCARLFLNPMIARMLQREPDAVVAPRAARLSHPLGANGPRETYLRAKTRRDNNGQIWVEVAADQDSSLVRVFAASDVLVVRTPNAPALAAEAVIDTIVMD